MSIDKRRLKIEEKRREEEKRRKIVNERLEVYKTQYEQNGYFVMKGRIVKIAVILFIIFTVLFFLFSGRELPSILIGAALIGPVCICMIIFTKNKIKVGKDSVVIGMRTYPIDDVRAAYVRVDSSNPFGLAQMHEVTSDLVDVTISPSLFVKRNNKKDKHYTLFGFNRTDIDALYEFFRQRREDIYNAFIEKQKLEKGNK